MNYLGCILCGCPVTDWATVHPTLHDGTECAHPLAPAVIGRDIWEEEQWG